MQYDRSDGEVNLLEAILLAAAKCGEDGAGRNGLVGYFYRIAREEPKLMMRLIERILAHELTCEPGKENRATGEIERILRNQDVSAVKSYQ
jgi:hypothetical protein